MEIEDKKQWHPAFCAAIELEFREDKDILQYEREYNLIFRVGILGDLSPR